MAALDSWSGHVLVIDAHDDVRENLRSTLTDCGWKVSTASSGAEGLAILEDSRPLAVLAGDDLSDLEGDTVLQRVREIDEDVPVLLLVAGVDQTVLLDALRSGAFDCLDRGALDDERAIPAVERAAAHYRKLTAARDIKDRETARFHELEDTVRSLRSQLATTELSLTQARVHAADADRAKSSFLANMSHELRTPLNAILGYAELLSEDAGALGSADALVDLQRIHGAGTHLLRLVSDVLDLARIESNKSEIFYESIQVRPLIEHAIAEVDLRGNNLVLGNVDQVEMVSDQAKLVSVLERIIGNAAKFTHQGQITIEAHQRGENVAISVADTGIGMTPAQVRTIFHEFSQGDGSTTRRYGGTGLGLTIALRLAQLLNGRIEVDSAPGQGSVFTLQLPIAPPSWNELLVPATPIMQPEPEPGTRTVLVIDGDATLRRQMATYLTKAGYRVISTPSGGEAMRLARTHRPAVISLDVVLPDVDGWNLLMAFKSDPELRDIPIVLVTVSDDRSRGLAVGAADFLPKPIRRESLLAVIRRVGPDKQAGPILVVEDDEATRDVTTRMLRAEGWEATSVENGRVALEWLEVNDAPSLILLDLMMPEIDGFHVITELQLREEWKSIPVVVFTAMDVPPARLSFLETHVETVIRKGGYGQAKMLEEVRALISRSL